MLGNIASYYYTKHQTVKMYNENIVNDMSLFSIAKVLSDSVEFLEVPVRHNEDVYNSELSKLVPYAVN